METVLMGIKWLVILVVGQTWFYVLVSWWETAKLCGESRTGYLLRWLTYRLIQAQCLRVWILYNAIREVITGKEFPGFCGENWLPDIWDAPDFIDSKNIQRHRDGLLKST